ncbi:MAG: hypothetical protein M3Y54_21340 [Bacteroidota bacterium]|nr:hypothetical protein [Bacteroidota bacterium]
MKPLATLLLALLTALSACPVRAQNYRPFRFGASYQLAAGTTAGDTTHLLRLASLAVQNADSVFTFSPRTSHQRPTPGQASCYGDYVRRADNLFGATLRLRPGAEYVLAASNGRTFTLKPRTPLGQAWAATATGLTAQVTARALGTVLGQPDSLATIALSDGATIVLSRRFGWVSGPALGHYLDARLPAAPLTLAALPEFGLGSPRLGAFVVYAFQPGDVFLRKTTSVVYLGPGAACTSYRWTRDSIISRTLSTNGDTLRYQLRSRNLLRDDCFTPPTLSAPTVQTLRITRVTDGLDQPTSFWAQPPPSTTAGVIHLSAYRTTSFNQRLLQPHFNYLTCYTSSPDSTVFLDTSNLDYGHHVWTAAGLGVVKEEFLSFSVTTTELIGYRKGTESWGQLTTFAQLLPARASRPASTTAAFPNPFTAELAVSFELSRPQAVGLTLRDALGREVLVRAPVPLLAGSQHLSLTTATLPEGVYTLHLHFATDGRTEVLRVLKAQ